MLEEFALQIATSLATVAPRTAYSPLSSLVQVVPPQKGPIVMVAVAPMAGSLLSMDDLMMLNEAAVPFQPSLPESALLTPSRGGQLDVACGDETPTSLEAARRLARFLDEERFEREPPLIASPPRQRTPVRRPRLFGPGADCCPIVGARSSL